MQFENAITDGRIAVGDRLPSERELAEVFHVSRPMVREALRVLDAFGIVSRRRGRGADSGVMVTAAGDDGLANLLRVHSSLLQIPLEDLLEVREALEGWMIRKACERATEETIAGAAEVVHRMQGVETPEEFLQLDTEFHLAIARASGNTTATLLMAALRDAIALQLLRAFQALPDWPHERTRLIREHRSLLAQIKSRKGEEAALALRRHIRNFYARALGKGGLRQTL